jgi:hypothetical protein
MILVPPAEELGYRPPGIGSQASAEASTRRTTAPDTAAGCRSTAMPGSRTSIGPGRSPRSPVWRKFVDIHRSQSSPIAEEAIGRIEQLYAVEKQARGSPPDHRTELRRAAVFDDLER